MDVEEARRLLLELPQVHETLQWGENLVFWAGNKALGGKMFALIDLSGGHGAVISFAAGPTRAPELLEREGFFPAPYLARAHWVAVQRWDVLRRAEWKAEFRSAYAYVCDRLPARVRSATGLSTGD